MLKAVEKSAIFIALMVMLLLLSWYKFSVEIMQDSDAFYECVTRPTNQQTQPIIEMRGNIQK